MKIVLYEEIEGEREDGSLAFLTVLNSHNLIHNDLIG